MAVPLPDRLLIVSHVLVRRSGEGLYVGGGFGRFLDSIAVHYREVAILTCYQEVPVAPDEYRLRSDNVEVLGIRPYARGGRLRRYTSMLLSAAHAALKLPSALRRGMSCMFGFPPLWGLSVPWQAG
jgi:hypothetical protein